MDHGTETEVEALAQQALQQIDKKRYANELAKYHGGDILYLGIGFSRKLIDVAYTYHE